MAALSAQLSANGKLRDVTASFAMRMKRSALSHCSRASLLSEARFTRRRSFSARSRRSLARASTSAPPTGNRTCPVAGGGESEPAPPVVVGFDVGVGFGGGTEAVAGFSVDALDVVGGTSGGSAASTGTGIASLDGGSGTARRDAGVLASAFRHAAVSAVADATTSARSHRSVRRRTAAIILPSPGTCAGLDAAARGTSSLDPAWIPRRLRRRAAESCEIPARGRCRCRSAWS